MTTQQPTPDQLQAVVDNAAATIQGGGALDDMARFQAAGCVVKLAADGNEDDLLNLVILIGAGKFTEAAAALMNLALSQGSTQAAAPFDPLAGIGLVNGPATTQAVPTPEPPTADPAATQAQPAARRGRRAPRGNA